MGKSSKDKRDAYYRLAKEQGWRARSAFKLLQLDEEFNLFEDVTRVVDLCAAPGSWSQVLSRVLIKGEKIGREAWTDKQAAIKLDALGIDKENPHSRRVQREEDPTDTTLKPRKDVKIVAIDLQPISPLPGIITLQADITDPSTIPLLLSALDPTYNPDTASEQALHPVDLVISDGAPDVTGLHDLDTYIQSQLLYAALNLARRVLKPGGKFVAKIFRAKDADLLYAQLRIVFDKVTVAKPRSSRASSVEAFVVCEGFKGDGPEVAAAAEQKRPVVEWMDSEEEEEFERVGNEANPRWIAPFLACGDLSSWDSDATYQLPKDRQVLDPVQPPTAPPYKRALEMRKLAGGAYGKTKGMFPDAAK